MGTTSDDTTTAPHRRPLPAGLTRDIERAGYYPALVSDVVDSAVAGDQVVSHLVHQETTFDHDIVRRHITVLVLTTRGWSSSTPTTTRATTRSRPPRRPGHRHDRERPAQLRCVASC